jgi:hypothetical protein
MAANNSLCYYFNTSKQVTTSNHIVSMKDEK